MKSNGEGGESEESNLGKPHIALRHRTQWQALKQLRKNIGYGDGIISRVKEERLYMKTIRVSPSIYFTRETLLHQRRLYAEAGGKTSLA